MLRRIAGRAIPQTVFLAPTYRCQCNCSNCYADESSRKNKDEISTEGLKAWIGQVKALGAVQLIITGGDPLLREDIFELVAHAHDIGLITRISTNGFLLDRSRVVELRRAGLNQCGIAIDDADRDTHDRLRGLPGLFDRAVQGFRFLREAGIEDRLITYACHSNLPGGMARILELAKRLGVSAVHINVPYASGRWAESYDEMFSYEDMDQLRRLQASVRIPAVLMEFPTPKAMCLSAKKSIIYIEASGEVTPCCVVPYVLGDMRNESLADIWKRHADGLRMVGRGICPMSQTAGREAFRKHADHVFPGKRGKG